MSRRRRLGVLLGLALLAPAPACRLASPSSPVSPGAAPVGSSSPAVVVDRRSGRKGPHSIRVAILPADDERLLGVLREEEVALAVGGRRYEERLLYATLDAPAEDALLAAFPGAEASLSPPASFTSGDEIEADAFSPEAPSGVTVHVVADGAADRIDALEIAVLVRPQDGALLPVIRGRVPVSGAGAYLLTGDVAGRRTFVALLRLDIEGAPSVARQAVPVRHHVGIRSFVLSSAALERALSDRSLPARGGPGGLSAQAVPAADAAGLLAALAGEGAAGGSFDETLRSGGATEIPFGLHRLAVAPGFRPGDGTYLTRLTLVDVAGAPSADCVHAPAETVLVLGWDAVAPGRSRAALVRVTPSPR